MFGYIKQRIMRKALNLFVQELYTFDRRHQCWNPIGCISAPGMKQIVDDICMGRITGQQASGDIHAN